MQARGEVPGCAVQLPVPLPHPKTFIVAENFHLPKISTARFEHIFIAFSLTDGFEKTIEKNNGFSILLFFSIFYCCIRETG